MDTVPSHSITNENQKRVIQMIEKAKSQCSALIIQCNKNKHCYVMNSEYYWCLQQNYSINEGYISLSCTQIASHYVEVDGQQKWQDLVNCYNTIFDSYDWKLKYYLKCLFVTIFTTLMVCFFLNSELQVPYIPPYYLTDSYHQQNQVLINDIEFKNPNDNSSSCSEIYNPIQVQLQLTNIVQRNNLMLKDAQNQNE